jgi:hypothetical protein
VRHVDAVHLLGVLPGKAEDPSASVSLDVGGRP